MFRVIIFLTLFILFFVIFTIIKSCTVIKVDKTFKKSEGVVAVNSQGSRQSIKVDYFVGNDRYTVASGKSYKGLTVGEKFVVWYKPEDPEVSKIDFTKFIIDSTRRFKETTAIIIFCKDSKIVFKYNIKEKYHVRSQYFNDDYLAKLNFSEDDIITIIYDELCPSISYFIDNSSGIR